jgi:hypothetical protein
MAAGMVLSVKMPCYDGWIVESVGCLLCYITAKSKMSVFEKTIASFNSEDFSKEFKAAVLSLGVSELNLQQAVQLGSVALPENLEVMLLNSCMQDHTLVVRSGIFFRSIIAGCNCADDPTPPNSLQEYAEVSFQIDSRDASYVIIFE